MGKKHLQNADNIVVNHKSSPLKKLNNLVFSDEVIYWIVYKKVHLCLIKA